MEKDKFKIRKDMSLGEQIKFQLEFMLIMLMADRKEMAQKCLNNISTLLVETDRLTSDHYTRSNKTLDIKKVKAKVSTPPTHWAEHEELGT